MKKTSLVFAVIFGHIFYGASALAADPEANSDLQAQLQNIQESAKQPNANAQSVNLPAPSSLPQAAAPESEATHNAALSPMTENAANIVRNSVTNVAHVGGGEEEGNKKAAM